MYQQVCNELNQYATKCRKSNPQLKVIMDVTVTSNITSQMYSDLAEQLKHPLSQFNTSEAHLTEGSMRNQIKNVLYVKLYEALMRTGLGHLLQTMPDHTQYRRSVAHLYSCWWESLLKTQDRSSEYQGEHHKFYQGENHKLFQGASKLLKDVLGYPIYRDEVCTIDTEEVSLALSKIEASEQSLILLYASLSLTNELRTKAQQDVEEANKALEYSCLIFKLWGTDLLPHLKAIHDYFNSGDRELSMMGSCFTSSYEGHLEYCTTTSQTRIQKAEEMLEECRVVTNTTDWLAKQIVIHIERMQSILTQQKNQRRALRKQELQIHHALAESSNKTLDEAGSSSLASESIFALANQSAYFRKQAEEQLRSASSKAKKHQGRSLSTSIANTEMPEAASPSQPSDDACLYYMTDAHDGKVWALSHLATDDYKLYSMENFETLALTFCSPFTTIAELTAFKHMAEKRIRILPSDSQGAEGIKFYHKGELCALKTHGGKRLICIRIHLNESGGPDQSSSLRYLYVPWKLLGHQAYIRFASSISDQENAIRGSRQRLSVSTAISPQPNTDSLVGAPMPGG